MTESAMLELIRRHYAQRQGNGPRYVFMPQVRSHAGFDSPRTLDAVVMDLWPSKGLHLHGFEIKCSRSDWLRELKQPEKAAMFVDRVDRFWVVAADKDVVRLDELPPLWGLLYAIRTPSGPVLHNGRSARLLPPSDERQSVQRSWLACLLRSASYGGAS